MVLARDIHTLDCVAYLGSYSFLDGALGTPNNINSGLHPGDYVSAFIFSQSHWALLLVSEIIHRRTAAKVMLGTYGSIGDQTHDLMPIRQVL